MCENKCKTQMCILKRCYRRNCWFAHSLKELNPPKCVYNTLCNKGDSCFFIHMYETKQEYIKRLGLSERKRENNKLSKLCSFKNKCERVGCTYAHSLEEIVPIPCIFGNKCKILNYCEYMHPCETKKGYIHRVYSNK